MLDLAIIGSGPAALSAALYAARLGLTVRILEKSVYGGTLAEISDLRNYPGFQGDGITLAKQMHDQVSAYPSVSLSRMACTDLSVKSPMPEAQDSDQKNTQYFELTLDDEEQLPSRTVLVASGASHRHLPFELKVPVSYCALCDGELARGKRVAVVGGANAAVQESMFLAKLAKSIDLYTHSQLKADAVLQTELRQFANIIVHEWVEPTAELLNKFDYVFVFIGQTPDTKFLCQLPGYPQLLDSSGYLLTGKSAANKSDLSHETRISGLFAAGDVRSGVIHQVITVAGDGAAAAIEIAQSLGVTQSHLD